MSSLLSCLASGPVLGLPHSLVQGPVLDQVLCIVSDQRSGLMSGQVLGLVLGLVFNLVSGKAMVVSGHVRLGISKLLAN